MRRHRRSDRSPLPRWRPAFALAVVGVMALSGHAVAAGPITITFENGTFDPNPPAGIEGTPSVFEAGALYEGFWYDDAGTPGATHNIGHTHVLWDDLASSLVDNPHSWRNGLQGVRISLLDQSAFRVVSIDYRIYERLPSDGEDPNSQLARLPWSHPWQDVHLLLSDSVDPVTPDFATFEAQWSAFAIDFGSEFDLGGGLTDPYRPAADDPWRTLSIAGFDDVTEIFIAHTGALVAFDNLVIEPIAGGGGGTVPEPGTGVLVGLGLLLLAVGRDRVQSVR